MTDWKNLISREDRDHINRLHRWAAYAAARGDMESSERLQAGASQVFERAVKRANTPA